MLGDAINFYHDLLTDDVAEEIDAALRQKLKEKLLYFGERPLCVVLRPHLYTEDNWNFLKNGLDVLLSAFAKAHRVCLDNDDYRAQLHLDPYEEELIPFDKAHVPAWTSSRLDTFYLPDKGILKVVEYNAETPAGIGYGDLLSDTFEELTIFEHFTRRYNTRTIRSLTTLTDALLDGYKRWGGQDKPQIAILDWREVPTLTEHEITRVHLERYGYKAILADPRNLEFREGHLWHEDFRIDMIYKRVLYSELIERMGLQNPVIEAVKASAVYITNSISAKMLAKKASLAFLSDEQNQDLFSQSELSAIHSYIPWTRVVSKRKTIYKNQEVDLVDFLAANKDDFALKPNDEYGGTGVVLGWQATSDEWSAALQDALESPYVVQERVTIPKRDFPMWDAGKLDISPRYVDADPYVFSGKSVDGLLTRLSPLALLNVTAGGGSVVPTVIISEK